MLDLSSNSLSGAIPQNLEKLASLEILNVSHNHLSGTIPQSFSSMLSLQSIDFSYNNLSGSISTGRAFLTATAEAYVGNSGLCGEVKGLTCPKVFLPDKSRGVNKKVLLGVIIPVCGLFIGMICVGILLSWRHSKKSLDEESRIEKKEPPVLLKDVLDQRLRPPTGNLAEAVVFTVTMAMAYTRAAPESRPMMRPVAQQLALATKQPCLTEPFGMITLPVSSDWKVRNPH
ncbi:hypothetical protein JHK85_007916 [Glycine max]|nr:hypothetical protein JHK85_007916 [Glycine max]